MIIIRPLGGFTGNGVLKGNLGAFDESGDPLGWEYDTNWSNRPNLNKAAESLKEDLGIDPDRARKLLIDAIKVARRVMMTEPEVPDEPPGKPIISARLPDLVDVVADAEGKPVYLFVTPTGLESAYHLDLDGVRYVPPELVHFPYKLVLEADVRGAFALDTDSQLFTDLLVWHQKASKLPSEAHYQLFGLFVLLTWLADRVDYALYLALESRDTERGKSRQAQGTAWICYRGIYTETLQEANLFRWADSLQATLVFDVRDLWRKAEKRGAEDLLLSRFQRNGPKVARVLDPQAGPFKGVTYFECYGPTLLAINEPLREPLASRTLSIVPPEAAGRYPTLQEADALPLKARCAAFRARHLLEHLPKVEKPADGRLGDIMQPLALMAEIIGGDLPDIFPSIVEDFRVARQAARAESNEAQLVAAIQAAINDGHLVVDVLPTAAVAEAYNRDLAETSG